MEARPYQAECIKAIWDYFKKEKGNPIWVMPTGSGKALTIGLLIQSIHKHKPDFKFLIVSHVKEIIEQNAKELQKLMPNEEIGIYSAGLGSKKIRNITFASIQSIFRKGDLFKDVGMLIVDECFTGDTLINTISGLKPIDKVRNGDYVYNATGIGQVEAISCKSTLESILKLEFSDGTKIKCTKNHPFFTNKGWKRAEDLALGEILFSEEDVLSLWQGNYSKTICKQKRRSSLPIGKKLEPNSILLNLLFQESRKLHERPCNSIKGKSSIERDTTSPNQTRREWAITSLSSASNSSCSRGRLASRSFCKNKNGTSQWKLSQPLQNRHCESRKKNRDRARRRISSNTGKTVTRSKENRTFSSIRLVNISHIKSESPRAVFNLQVSGHPSYFANGKLVHNCHLLSKDADSMYQKLISSIKNDKLKIAGCSATPMRMDQGSLISEGSIFSDIVYDISIRELINNGYLCPLISKPKESVDLTNVKMSGFDFNSVDLEIAFAKDLLITKHCEEIIKNGEDRKSWLIFCSGINHAKLVSEKFRTLGIKADYITGEMVAFERDRKIEDFKNGTIKCLCNVNVLTTGFNYPGVDLVGLLRATKSASLYIQMVGRGSRTCPDKSNCLVLDYGNNIETHGPVDLIQIKKGKSNKAEVGKLPSKKCGDCGAVVGIKTKTCLCGYEFPESSFILETKPSEKAILSEVETYKVKGFRVLIHEKPDKPQMIKVQYYTDGGTFTDYLCFNHGGYSSQMARKKWVEKGGIVPAPSCTETAYERQDELKEPDTISVIKNGKYYEVLKLTFSDKKGKDLEEIEGDLVNI